MSTQVGSIEKILYSVAQCTANANMDFTLKELPDFISVASAGGATLLLLPKIGTENCPVGTVVNIRNNTGTSAIVITPATAPAQDTIETANTNNTFLPAAKNSCRIQATAGTASTAGNWQLIESSVASV